MIRGEVIKEMYSIQRNDVDYRALGALNSSMVKLFDSDPVKFYEQFKLGKERKQRNTVSTTIGDIVDFYLLDCKGDETEFDNRWDEKFVLFSGAKSGQVYSLADELFAVTKDSLNEEGEVSVSFDTRFDDAFAKMQAFGYYKGKSKEKALKDFNDNAYDYFQALMDNIGKNVVEMSLLEKAKRIAKDILNDPFTKDVFEVEEYQEFFAKLPIEWKYTCTDGKEMECKAEPDILKVDHNNRMIYILDVKTTFDNENFEFSYIKNGYYLQSAFYFLAVQQWAKNEGMGNYTVIPTQFVVGDTSVNNRRPLIYKMSDTDLVKSLNGFCLNGHCYNGLYKILDDISWAEKNDLWNCSKEVYDSKGLIPINLKYD
jgi:hypothetical protein